jgi:hypothetical protein
MAKAKNDTDTAADAAADDQIILQDPVSLPSSVRPVRDYGFIAGDGSALYWRAGQTVTDPEHVAALVTRGVEFHPEV